ncbi:MAG: SpoIIE family protein phosphatase, partial [Rhodopirellula bahusiensis]
RSNILAVAREALIRQMIAVFLAGSLAAFLVNLVLRKIVTKPIRRLVTSLQSVGDGNLESRVDVHSCRELTYLGEQFNDMASKLDAAERDRRVHMTKARAIQQNLRPSSDAIPGLNIAALFKPADDVGGDYYDVIRLNDDSTLLCIADVCGHGVPAAMAATLLKAFVAEAAKQSHHPAEILTRVNQQYYEYVILGYFATMVLVRVDMAEKQLVYANAGHELPFVQCDQEPVQRLDHSDLILGVEADTTYEECCRPICSGTKLVLVSDGVTEAFNPDDEQFGTERVSDTIARAIGEHASDLVVRFDSALEAFRDGRQAFDDTTLVVAELMKEEGRSSEAAG